jgi:PAS domain-containing protein
VIQVDPVAAMALAVVAALWLAAAFVAIFIGMRRGRVASKRRAHLDRLSALIDAAPGVPLLIAPDGRVVGGVKLAGLLGSEEPPADVAALVADGGGIAPDDAARLALDIEGLRQSGRAFSRPLRLAGSDRVLIAQGKPAPRALGEGALIWLYDQSDSVAEIRRLSEEAERISDALDSCLALIEAAPFPMWHRGPDLHLALVNSAYVAAVEGGSAEQVVTRGIELVDAAEGRNPCETARAADRKSVV